jgi:hypothetical protein
VANYSKGDLRDVTPYWILRDSKGTKIAGEKFSKTTIAQGGLQTIGDFHAELHGVSAPQKLTLETGIESLPVSNSWDIWVYPTTATDAADPAVVFSESPTEAIQRAAAGHSVILLAAGHLKDPEPIRYPTPFWNTIMFRTQPKSMGLLCDPRHPALAHFPTESYSTWQWWDLVSNHTNAARLNWTDHPYRPIVQVVDHAPRNDKLGVIFEFKVGSGRILISTLDLSTDLERRFVARQLRQSVAAYAASPAFAPASVALPEQLGTLFQ